MSHYSTLKTTFKDQDVLVDALKNIYGQGVVEVHENPVNLYDWQNNKTDNLAHVIVRRQYISSLSNDMGFVKQADGTYAMIVSDFDRYNRHDPRCTIQKKAVAEAYMASYLKMRAPRNMRVLKNEGGRITLQIVGR